MMMLYWFFERVTDCLFAAKDEQLTSPKEVQIVCGTRV